MIKQKSYPVVLDPAMRKCIRNHFPDDVDFKLMTDGYQVTFTGLSRLELMKLAETARELRKTA